MADFLEISVASVCKVGCKYCPVQVLYKSNNNIKAYMDYDNFTKVIDKLPLHITIDFAGYVEPWLNDRTADMIVYTYNKGFKVRLYSTLAECRESDIEKIKNVKFESVVLHLPDIYGYMNIKVDEQYKKICRLFREAIPVNEAHSYGPVYDDLRPIFPNYVEKELSPQHLHNRAGNVKTDLFQLEVKQPLLGPIVCGVVWRENSDKLSHNVLNYDFGVRSCCCDYAGENVFGNLLTDEYEDLFKSEGYLKMKKAMASYDDPVLCRTCKEVYPAQDYQ